MSFLTVSHVSHSFGGRQILEDVSFKLEKGEHIGLVGANGGASYFAVDACASSLLMPYLSPP